MMEWEFEDKLDAAGIFRNGITGALCHREAYMAIMSYDKMDIFLAEQKENYAPSQWLALYQHFRSMGYLSPMNSLVASRILFNLGDVLYVARGERGS